MRVQNRETDCAFHLLCKERMLPSALGEVFSSLVPLRATYKRERFLKKEMERTVRNTISNSHIFLHHNLNSSAKFELGLYTCS